MAVARRDICCRRARSLTRARRRTQRCRGERPPRRRPTDRTAVSRRPRRLVARGAPDDHQVVTGPGRRGRVSADPDGPTRCRASPCETAVIVTGTSPESSPWLVRGIPRCSRDATAGTHGRSGSGRFSCSVTAG
jgi:hypothetical protein